MIRVLDRTELRQLGNYRPHSGYGRSAESYIDWLEEGYIRFGIKPRESERPEPEPNPGYQGEE